MRLSLLQPRITHGSIEENTRTIQRLINEAEGDLLILPEHALTGSLVLEENVDIQDWVRRSTAARAALRIPPDKYLLLNSLSERDDGRLINSCDLLPTDQRQIKPFLNRIEQELGFMAGSAHHTFDLFGRRFRAIIYTGLRNMQDAVTEDLDFAVQITDHNYALALEDARRLSEERGLRIFISSLASDLTIGFSAYIEHNILISLPREEGILEVTIV